MCDFTVHEVEKLEYDEDYLPNYGLFYGPDPVFKHPIRTPFEITCANTERLTPYEYEVTWHTLTK